jgi:hypothetical protein
MHNAAVEFFSPQPARHFVAVLLTSFLWIEHLAGGAEGLASPRLDRRSVVGGLADLASAKGLDGTLRLVDVIAGHRSELWLSRRATSRFPGLGGRGMAILFLFVTLDENMNMNYDDTTAFHVLNLSSCLRRSPHRLHSHRSPGSRASGVPSCGNGSTSADRMFVVDGPA